MALTDGIVRSVYFQAMDGEFKWMTENNIIETTFKENLNDKETRQRLSVANDPNGSWLEEVIAKANQDITIMRHDGYRNAAGIVFAKDINSAKKIARSMTDKIAETPVVATSDEPESLNIIKKFKTSSDKWIVAVRQISEGIDIPRLGVGVYATNIKTDLSFIQMVGRTIRIDPNHPDYTSAKFYIPADSQIMQMAKDIIIERNHELQEEEERQKQTRELGEQQELFFQMIETGAAKTEKIIHSGNAFERFKYEFAEKISRQMGDTVDPAKLVIAFDLAHVAIPKEETQKEDTEKVLTREKYKSIRKQVIEAVNKLARKYIESRGLNPLLIGNTIKKLHAKLNREQGILSIDKASYEMLIERLEKIIPDWWKNGFNL